MTIYAVHYAWIPGHHTQGPVGIWDATGAHYYPELTAEHQSSGAAYVMPVVRGQLAHTFESWLESKAETTSTYDNWDRIDSYAPMQKVLDAMLAEFLAEEHPVGQLIVPDPVPEPEPETGLDDEAVTDPMLSNAPPALRRRIAESWWIASELAARHPERLVSELHPGGGTYDCLSLTTPGAVSGGPIYLNREGTIQVHAEDGGRTLLMMPWADAMAARSLHDVVKQLEAAAGLELRGKRPPTTARTLVYRAIAAFLGQQLNDRDTWDVRCEFNDNSGSGGSFVVGYLAGFPLAQAAARQVERIGIWGEPESHYWAILRNDEPVAVLSIEGELYLDDTEIALFPLYQETKSVAAVVARTLGRFLQ